MTKMIKEQRLGPSPTLNTILMVEEVIKNAKNSLITIPEIKRALPRQVNHATLRVILKYLGQSGKIIVTLKGIAWAYDDDQNIRRIIEKWLELGAP